jgi:hypothetical protein
MVSTTHPTALRSSPGLGFGSHPRRADSAEHQPRSARRSRNDVEARRQKAAFFFDGELIDVCDAGPCAAAAR